MAPESAKCALLGDGWARVPGLLSEAEISGLRESLADVFGAGAGKRALLARPEVRESAVTAGRRLADLGLLRPTAPAIQAIAFNKTPGRNWNVAWHQDLQFPLSGGDGAAGCSGSCRKDGVDYAQPAAEVLAGLLAVRLHLDDCDAENGPLRVFAGSHREGVLEDEQIEEWKAKAAEGVCLARSGDAILMRPLLLHASSVAREPRQRRVLHLVFAETPLPAPARWIDWERQVAG